MGVVLDVIVCGLGDGDVVCSAGGCVIILWAVGIAGTTFSCEDSGCEFYSNICHRCWQWVAWKFRRWCDAVYALV